MEKVNYSKYNLIKAVLASNLEEDMKENIVNSLINCYQPQPIYYGLTTTTSDAIRNLNITYTGDLKC
jgi:hypothetical protein